MDNNTVECPNCHNVLNSANKFCTKCGTPLDSATKDETNISLIECPNCHEQCNPANEKCPKCGTVLRPQKQLVTSDYFCKYVVFNDKKMIESFLSDELKKVELNGKSSLIPSEAVKRKMIMNLIFGVLVFIYVSMIFFHFPFLTYFIGLIILIVFYNVANNYTLMKYLVKQVKARPSEKISNIVMNAKNNLVSDHSKLFGLGLALLGIVASLIIFMNPIIWYEKTDGGYSVRYYLFGVKNFTTAEIPATHNGENVVSLRGNAFSNMWFLESVKLPDTVTEIRAEAFLNCYRLKEVNLPVNLQEIKGNTFENCKSLKSITIPDSVTRIGGHAFYGASSLKEVILTKNSRLHEIGSSAFRNCYSLYSITIPKGVYVNERAFKGSPTKVHFFPKDVIQEDSSTITTKSNTFNDLEPMKQVYFEDYDNNAEVDAYEYGLDIKVTKLENNNYNVELSE